MKVNDIITEVFDKPYPLRWKKAHRNFYAFATLNDGTNLSIYFEPGFKENEWFIEFTRNEGQDISGMGDSQKVFATVLSAIKEFVALRLPKAMFITVSKSADPRSSRFKLYKKLIDRYAATAGFDSETIDHDKSSIFKLTKKSAESL